MFLHDIGFDKFDIACEDTLTTPKHWDDEPFELAPNLLLFTSKSSNNPAKLFSEELPFADSSI